MKQECVPFPFKHLEGKKTRSVNDQIINFPSKRIHLPANQINKPKAKRVKSHIQVYKGEGRGLGKSKTQRSPERKSTDAK